MNQAKGDAEPSNWLPPNHAYRCTSLRFGITAIGRTPLRQGEPELGEPLGNGAMLDAAAAPVAGDEPAIAEDFEVLGDRGE